MNDDDVLAPLAGQDLCPSEPEEAFDEPCTQNEAPLRPESGKAILWRPLLLEQ
ncbi:hypothetical protein [Pseudomonas floridensis]|uniref:hypothetical protein n=1 Tax=Pseudomonas floridensis TaxID=1958950 RepID=UPI0012FF84D6|nr:hypothetical protein [Pseudomonas floridensis]